MTVVLITLALIKTITPHEAALFIGLWDADYSVIEN
jgi:hypothetical protein